MKHLDLIGRLLFAVPMILSGFFHFTKASVVTRTVPAYMPFKEIWVYVTGVGFILAAISIIIGKKSRLGAGLLGLMILLFAFLIHFKGFLRGVPLASSWFIRDVALAGGALFIASKAKD